MGLFKKRKTNYVGQMREYLRAFMLKYIDENTDEADVVVNIFSDAEQLIRKLPEKDLEKALKQDGIVNVEYAVLNIVQNLAMANLKPISEQSIILSQNPILNLYNFINKKKLKCGYITQQQYDENGILGISLSLHSPF